MTPQGTDVDAKSTLDRCALLEPLSDSQIAALAERCEVVALKESDPLFEGDAAAHNLFVVAEGRMAIRLATPSGRLLDELEVGLYTLNGWLSLVDRNLYVAEAHAVQDSTVLVISADDMEAVLLSEPEVAYRVMKTIAGLISLRLRRMKEGFAELFETREGVWDED